MLHRSVMKSLRIPVALFALAISPLAQAVQFIGNQTAPGVWTYDLIYNPNDNYSIYPVASQATNLTTITLTGLFGVTSATGPQSTSYTNSYANTLNLAWAPQVLNGGTTVQWTHTGPGTGNFDTDMFVYGFRIYATGAIDGQAYMVTNGFSKDTHLGGADVDIAAGISGPVAAVPESETYAMFLAGLGLMGAIARRKK